MNSLATAAVKLAFAPLCHLSQKKVEKMEARRHEIQTFNEKHPKFNIDVHK